MTTPLTAPDLASPKAPAAPSRRPLRLTAWLREPLLHFVALGGLLFAVDHALVVREDDPRLIVVGASVDQEARQLFKASRGREPNADELAALRRAWLDNEVLYREGLALRVDRGDTAIRERVIFKALSVVDANLKRPPVDDAALRRWFEQRRAKYDEPARYDFQEAVPVGDGGEAAVRALAEQLNRGGAQGELNASLRVFKGRPQGNLVEGYGEAFVQSLAAAPLGEWRVHRARDGWRVMRVEATTPARPAEFEALRGVVLQDWTDAVMAEQRTAAVRALAKKYTVRHEEAAR